MEIFNNIWTALSTPNEGLVNILLIPCAFIENVLIMYLFLYILNIKANRKQKIIYVILLCKHLIVKKKMLNLHLRVLKI